MCRKKQPTDELNLWMLALLLELLRSEAESLPELAVGGAWQACANCLIARPAVARQAVESGFFDLGAAHLRTMEPADQLVRCCVPLSPLKPVCSLGPFV